VRPTRPLAWIMPSPGDPYANAFRVEFGQCWRIVHDERLQATHCPEEPAWTGRWFSPRNDRWWRVWSCERHADGLTGLRRLAAQRRR
jgi:hypothetical protein